MQTHQDSINKLLNFHIKENHLPSSHFILKKEALLIFLGLGGLNYVPVAYYSGDLLSIKIINAVTTAILGEIVLYTSGEYYYKAKIQPQYVDPELQGIIAAPLTSEEFFWEVLLQGVLALGSAVPLATTLFDADLKIFKENPGFFWFSFAFILAVNTAMHLVPIELTLRDPWYSLLPRIIFSPLMIFWRYLYPLSQQAKNRLEYIKLRNDALGDMLSILDNAKQHYLKELVRHDASYLQERFSWSSDQFLAEMLTYHQETLSLGVKTKLVARFLGATMVASACLGYAANPYLVFNKDFGFSVKASLSITFLPIYFFMLLMAFFGDGMGVRFFQDMQSLKSIVIGKASKKEKLPSVAQLYPRAYFMAGAVILFIAIFAGAPGRKMMKQAFDTVFPSGLMIAMMGVVDIGIGMLGWYAPIDFLKSMLAYYALYMDVDSKQHDIALVKAKIEALIRDIARLEDAGLANDMRQHLQNLAPVCLKSAFDLPVNNAAITITKSSFAFSQQVALSDQAEPLLGDRQIDGTRVASAWCCC